MGVPEVAELLRLLLTIATCCWIARIRTSYTDTHFDKRGIGRAAVEAGAGAEAEAAAASGRRSCCCCCNGGGGGGGALQVAAVALFKSTVPAVARFQREVCVAGGLTPRELRGCRYAAVEMTLTVATPSKFYLTFDSSLCVKFYYCYHPGPAPNEPVI